MNKTSAQKYITDYLEDTRDLWKKTALSANAGNRMMVDATTHIKSNGKLDQFGTMVLDQIEKQKQIPSKFFEAIAVLSGKMDKGRKAISESVMKWIFGTRSALTSTYQSQAIQEGKPKAEGTMRRNSDPKWLAIEQYRLRKDPSMLFSAYHQGLFPSLQPVIPDLLYLHPEYEDILTGERQVSFAPTTSSSDSGSGTFQSGSSGYGEEDHGSNFARILLLGALGAGVYYVYKK